MAAQSGGSFLLKKGNGEVPNETFTLIAGMKTTAFTMKNSGVDSTDKESGAWRELMAGTGKRSVSISGSGVFMDSSAEETIRGWAFTAAIKNYQISFGNGDGLKGAFLITSYQRTGDVNNEEAYSITLESAGEIVYTVG